MSAATTRVKLAECVDLLAGFAFKSDQFTESPDDIVLIKGENVGQGAVIWDKSRRWPEQDWCNPKLAKYRLAPGDIVVAMDRPWVPAGLKWCHIRVGDPPAFLVQRCARLRACEPMLDQSYLRHIIGGPGFESYVRPITSGVNVPHISGSQILDFEVALPPLDEQRRIAGILSAYDDLIENCQRRIRILEELARRLYREWFVHFRYPGHESIPLVPSPLGPIPQGWEVKNLREVADVNRKQINTKTAPIELHYIDIASVSPGKIDEITTYAFDAAPGRARRVVQHGDVIWSTVRPNRRSYALVLDPVEDTIASTGFAVLTAKTVPFAYLYLATTTDEFVSYLTNHATGAAYPAVTGTTFECAPLLVPSSLILERFSAAATPMFEKSHVLLRQTTTLRRTRDLLLPRLLSSPSRERTN